MNPYASDKLNVIQLCISGIITLLVCILLWFRVYHHALFVLTLISTCLLIFTSLPKQYIFKLRFGKPLLLYILLFSLPLVIRILFYDITRFHGDDLLSSYFSATTDWKNTNMFAGIPTDKGQWVCQFPAIYFYLQYLFFRIFGASLLTVKLSVLPYIFIIGASLYGIAATLFDKKTGVISVILYSFFAPALYLETLGLHFASSTAAFTTAVFLMILTVRHRNYGFAVATGIVVGLCYLTYTSSYIAGPLIICTLLISALNKRSVQLFASACITLIISLMIIAPYGVYTIRNGNYFPGRAKQVSLVNGEWSPVKNLKGTIFSYVPAITSNAVLSFRSVYTDGLSGHGGYNFGKRALLDPLSLILFIAGCLIIWKQIRHSKLLLIIPLTVCTAFFFGVILTIPPPAFHRFSVVFPMLVLIMALPISVCFVSKLLKPVGMIIAVFIIIVYSIINIQIFKESAAPETNNEAFRLAGYIAGHYDNNIPIYVASFPGYVLEKEFYFMPVFDTHQIKTDYHQNFLNSFPPEPYLFVYIFPEVFEQKFIAKNPNGKTVQFSKTYGLFSD